MSKKTKPKVGFPVGFSVPAPAVLVKDLDANAIDTVVEELNIEKECRDCLTAWFSKQSNSVNDLVPEMSNYVTLKVIQALRRVTPSGAKG